MLHFVCRFAFYKLIFTFFQATLESDDDETFPYQGATALAWPWTGAQL